MDFKKTFLMENIVGGKIVFYLGICEKRMAKKNTKKTDLYKMKAKSAILRSDKAECKGYLLSTLL